MWSAFTNFFDIVWGVPLTIFIVGVGIYFSSSIKFRQITKLPTIFKKTFENIKKGNSYKVITSVLGGTVGSGNIVGIATAIAAGGPGAVFWMWLIALFSMATKMVEVTLAVYYQEKDKNGNNYGGAMYYIKEIGGKLGKILALIYSVCLLIYILCDSGFVQINTLSTSLTSTFNIKTIYVGVILIILSIFLISGGLKRISKLLEKLVPFMCLLYLISALIVIFANVKNLPHSLSLIFTYAFKPAPIIGGFMGASVVQAISKGASRGIFANEAGIGTSTTVHATTTNTPVMQGYFGVVEVYIVSFVVCTISALLVLTTNAWQSGIDGAPMVLLAFKSLYGNSGKYLLSILIALFTYSTYIGFYYEYISCIRYLFPKKLIKFIKWLYIVPMLFAIFMPIDVIWSFADIAIGFIIIPNLISLLILSKKFKKIYREGILYEN